MYAHDHLPPHFHVGMNDGRECLIEIDTMQFLAGASIVGNLLMAWHGRRKIAPCCAKNGRS